MEFALEILYYGALLLAQVGQTTKQYAMKLCGRRTAGEFNSVCINMARAVICLIVSAVIWLACGGGTTNAFGHFLIIAAGIGTALSLFTWILASAMVPLMLIESVSMIGSLVLPLILAPYLYNGDTVKPVQWVGCALVFLSIFFFMNKDTGEKKQVSAFKKAVMVIACVASGTVSLMFKKHYTFHITAKGLGGVEYYTFLGFVTVLAVFLILFAVFYSIEKKKLPGKSARVELPYKKVWIYILLAAIALYVNELFTSYATNLPSAIFYTLSRGLIVLGSFLLDVIAFKDKVTVKKLIGLFIVITAIILVNL